MAQQNRDQDILNEGGAINQVSGGNDPFELNDKLQEEKKKLIENNRQDTKHLDEQMLPEKHADVSDKPLNRNKAENKKIGSEKKHHEEEV